jgi:hypothetical protein
MGIAEGRTLQAAAGWAACAGTFALMLADRGLDVRGDLGSARADRGVQPHRVRFPFEARGQLGGTEGRDAKVQLALHARTLDGHDPDGVAAPSGHDLEALTGSVLEHSMTGADTQPVAAPLGLRAIRVEDADRQRGRVKGEQTVGPQAQMTVADAGKHWHNLVQRGRQVQHQVVVAERLVFDQSDRKVLDNHRRLPRMLAMLGQLSVHVLPDFALEMLWPAQRRIQSPACFCN